MAKNFVITRYRDSNSKLRTQLLRIRAKAGVGAWPRLFQNLRSTRETESAENFPDHVVCAWNGNSERVAREHYLQITDEHFAMACGDNLQNPMQKAAAAERSEEQPDTSDIDNYRENHYLHSRQLAEAGVEPARGLPPNGF